MKRKATAYKDLPMHKKMHRFYRRSMKLQQIYNYRKNLLIKKQYEKNIARVIYFQDPKQITFAALEKLLKMELRAPKRLH